MDYKYINQLLERYWECQTTLEEERILRAFFSQDDIPASLMQYRDLFTYESLEVRNDKLDEEFDRRVISMIADERPVKARTISIGQRLRPLFKAAAVVAIILTLGNAIQVPFNNEGYQNVPGYENNTNGSNVAKQDSAKIDSIGHQGITAADFTSTKPAL